MNSKKIIQGCISGLLLLLVVLSLVGILMLWTGVHNADRTGTFNLFGYSFHLNKSTAMEPLMMRNDLIVVKHTNFSQIRENDFAAFYYQTEDGEHLLVRKVEKIDNLVYTVTDTAGGKLEISAENVRFLGKATSRSPKLGRAVLFLQTDDGKMIFLGWTAGIALCLVGLTILVHLIRKMLQKQSASPQSPADKITGEPLSFDKSL